MTQMPVESAPDPSRPQVLAIVSPGAGSADEESVGAALVALREVADVEAVTPSDRAELSAALEVLGDRRLVVLGGDGTLNIVVQALHDTGRLSPDAPVGVLPMGTGNDLAGNLGLPVDDPAAASRIAVSGTPRSLDILLSDAGDVVVNAAHVGIGAVASQHADGAKPVIGAAAFAAGAVLAGATETGWQLRVVVDGEELLDGSIPALMAAVTVGRTIGGGAPVAPDAVPDDGQAEVVVSLATGPGARVSYGLDLRRGEHTNRDDVVTARGARVEITTADGEPFPVNVDGEVRDAVQGCSWRVVPRAWSVLAPSA